MHSKQRFRIRRIGMMSLLQISDSDNKRYINWYDTTLKSGICQRQIRSRFQNSTSGLWLAYCVLYIKFLVLSTARPYPTLVSLYDRALSRQSYMFFSCWHAHYRITTFSLQLHAAAILLTHMRESYVFATIREMIDDTSHFLPVSQKEYYSWCKTYSFFVEKMFPATHKVMEKCGALDPQSGLDPIFKRFFSTILKREVSWLLCIELFLYIPVISTNVYCCHYCV